MGEWTEAWVLKLRALGCKASTVSVYVNGVISVSSFALSLVPDDGGERCPTHELLALRKQAESISKQERLFEAKHKHWLPWEDAQKARVACVEKYNAATSAEQKKALLRDCLILAFHTLQPPDRVGGAARRGGHPTCNLGRPSHRARVLECTVVRRLRLGYPNGSLYKKPGESTYTVDLSRLKHKTR